jgi:hypothetical protein
VLKVTCGRETLCYGDEPSLPASKKLKNQGWSKGSFVIECFYIHFDGTRFGPVNTTFQIRKFENDKDIRMLPVFPLQCDPKADDTRRYLVERGDKFTELSNPQAPPHRKYKGLTLDKNKEQARTFVDDHLAS